MEALSPTMEEGRLVRWLKAEGDPVKTGETLAEVETDKAVMELVARADGVLRATLMGEGETAPVGALLAVIATPGESIEALVGGTGGGRGPRAGRESTESAAPPEAAGAAGSAAGEGTSPEQVIANAEETAGASPIPLTAGQSQGDASMPPQEKLAGAPRASSAGRLGNAAPKHRAPGRPEPRSEQAPHAGDGGRHRSSPLARRLASERGLDIEQVRGSGPHGRVIKRDIEAVVAAGDVAVPLAGVGGGQGGPGDYEDVALTQIRKTIARRLSESLGPIPTFYLTAEFDLTRVTELRAAMAEMGDEFKVSVNDVVLKAVATALARHPGVNAHWLGDRIRYWNRVHLGMAVATEDGLIVPVIFDADRKRLSELSVEAKDLAGRARERKLAPEEFTGATFSVSNLGMYGIDQFTAIINPPEAGILAIGAAHDGVVAEEGKVTVRRRIRVTMSCDHRVVDGAVGARFLQTFKRMIENPLMLVY